MSDFGDSKIFCLFDGGVRVDGDMPEVDAANSCGVGVCGLEGCECNSEVDPPYKKESY